MPAIASYLSLSELKVWNEIPYVRVAIPGDSNCGPNSIALWWISQLLLGKMAFISDDFLKKLRAATKEKHVQLAFTGRAKRFQFYSKSLDWLASFTAIQRILFSNEIDTITADRASFINFIKQYQTLPQIGALHVALGLLLKDISYAAQIGLLQADFACYMEAAEKVAELKTTNTLLGTAFSDRENPLSYSDPSLLESLCHELGATLQTVKATPIGLAPLYNNTSSIDLVNKVTVLFIPDPTNPEGPDSHWDLLLPYTTVMQAFPDLAKQTLLSSQQQIQQKLSNQEFRQYFTESWCSSAPVSQLLAWFDSLELSFNRVVLDNSKNTDQQLAFKLQLDEIMLAITECEQNFKITDGLNNRGLFNSDKLSTKPAIKPITNSLAPMITVQG